MKRKAPKTTHAIWDNNANKQEVKPAGIPMHKLSTKLFGVPKKAYATARLAVAVEQARGGVRGDRVNDGGRVMGCRRETTVNAMAVTVKTECDEDVNGEEGLGIGGKQMGKKRISDIKRLYSYS
ncbi:hypothetical protein Fot_32133 [Forsythia ovata]|uniref:Uncharacterized protein n=1 Tax=Forsythia ovata TaxID=205694 RepID=A0ABD1T6X7_9LAMI